MNDDKNRGSPFGVPELILDDEIENHKKQNGITSPNFANLGFNPFATTSKLDIGEIDLQSSQL